jgi:hypothetical protein
MPDGLTLAAAVLVLGPFLGAIPVAYPPFWPIWSATRDVHLATVGAHRRAWSALNAGFAVATISTAAATLALATLTGAGAATAGPTLTAAAVVYAIGGALWCAVLAIRMRTTPALASLVAAGAPTEPAETLLAAATGGLYAAFVLTTAAALVAVGIALLAAGTVVAPVAVVVAVAGVLMAAWYLVAGDVIPAAFYPPTMLVGVALLLGWG